MVQFQPKITYTFTAASKVEICILWLAAPRPLAHIHLRSALMALLTKWARRVLLIATTLVSWRSAENTDQWCQLGYGAPKSKSIFGYCCWKQNSVVISKNFPTNHSVWSAMTQDFHRVDLPSSRRRSRGSKNKLLDCEEQPAPDFFTSVPCLLYGLMIAAVFHKRRLSDANITLLTVTAPARH